RQLELLEPLAGHRHADDAARVFADERDHLGRAGLRSHREVTLVLAVLVVDDDDHVAGRDLGDRFIDGAERRQWLDDPRMTRDLPRRASLLHESSLVHDLRSKRSTYFATMSTSMLTASPTPSAVCGVAARSRFTRLPRRSVPRVERAMVSGTTSDAKPRSSRSITVRHTPATLTLSSTERRSRTRAHAISRREPDLVGLTWRTVPSSSTMPVNT